MDRDTLERHMDQTMPLTGNDRRRLRLLADVPEYESAVLFMLANNCKLEQEQIGNINLKMDENR